MGTRNYKLPTVDEDATLDFVNAVNGLATSTDAVLHGIQTGFERKPYDLPVATSETLGGVRVGDGFTVYSDGLLTTTAEKYKLTPATADAIGGVAIGKNVTVNGEGAIGIGKGAFGNIEATDVNLANGGINTSKIVDYAVSADKLGAQVYNQITNATAWWTNADKKVIKYNDVYRPIKINIAKISDALVAAWIMPSTNSLLNVGQIVDITFDDDTPISGYAHGKCVLAIGDYSVSGNKYKADTHFMGVLDLDAAQLTVTYNDQGYFNAPLNVAFIFGGN